MAISLSQIEAEWSSYEPAGQRPLAGRRALAGFNYQLSLSLAAFFESLFRSDPAAAHAFEGLSDVAELSGGLLYITQVKLTLSTDRLKEAYREFLIVDRFLEDRFPLIREATRYRVFCRAMRGQVREDVTAKELGLEGGERKRWDELRPRVLRFEVHGDPTLDLILSLWGKVARPYSFVNGLRGFLLDRLSAGATSETISLELVQRLEGERVETAPPGTILSPSDFADRSAGWTDVLIGQRPAPDDIARGCFMEREERLRPVIEKVQAALAAGDSSRGEMGKLPVIWIAGGSGTGKSVLLLQTLARLMSEVDVPLHFLRHLVSQLPAALDFWRRQGHAAVVTLDDLFAPDARGADLWQRIHEAAAASPPVTLLTCGPTEYLEAFEQQENRHGLLELQRVDLPPLDAAERTEFRAWYAQRTGRTDIRTVQASNFVVASFLLERQRQGQADLAEFAARLRERLAAHGLFAEFIAALAANRLGVAAPMSLFEGQRDAFHGFVTEGLCQKRDVPEQHEAVLWFHQALAHAIYEALVPAEAGEERATHLDRFFQSLVDDYKAGKSFLDLLGKSKEQRLPARVAREALRKIGCHLAQREPPDLKILMMFIWQDAAKARELPVERILQAERLRRWMASPAVDAQGWGLLFQLLWQRSGPEAKRESASAATTWLSRNGELSQWSFVWRMLWEDGYCEQELVELAKRWLAPQSASRAWAWVFHGLFDRGVRSAWLKDAAIRGLAAAPVTAADRFLWRKCRELGVPNEEFLDLLTRRLCRGRIAYVLSEGVRLIVDLANQSGWETVKRALDESQSELSWPYLVQELARAQALLGRRELLRDARTWLPGREDRAEWTHVWRRLLELAPDDDALRQAGRAWLPGREERPEWTHVWLRLLELAPDDHELLAAGRAWLPGREERPEWTHVWLRLLELALDDHELLAVGRAWLPGREERPEWTHFWEQLLVLSPADDELRAAGRAWLVGREERADWSYVWQRLLDLAPDDELRATGHAWLAGREDRPEWNYVWRRLLEVAPDDDELRAAGRAWLQGREDRTGWNYVWQRLLESAPDDDELRAAGHAWLPGREDRADWTHVWRRLLELAPDDDELRVAGRAWLPGREDRQEWTHVCRQLLELAPDDDELREAGRTWLPGREERADWAYFWQRLLELAPDDDELRVVGRAWLPGREDRAAWTYVWQRLFELAPDDELRAAGRGWLVGREDRADWSYVWQRLLEFAPDDELRAAGRAWLPGREDRADWSYVWQRLLELAPDDELRAAGRAWLPGREGRANWNYVWQVLWRCSPDDSLKQQGEEWIHAHPRHPGAAHVRRELSRLRPNQSVTRPGRGFAK